LIEVDPKVAPIVEVAINTSAIPTMCQVFRRAGSQ
jgi:hypothetical protein